MTSARHSATLLINELIQTKREAGEHVVHLGFGEAGLPVLPMMREAVTAASVDNSYGRVLGSIAAREAAAGWFTRRGIDTTVDQVVFAPGSKALLYAIIAITPGAVVLPQPSWVSYAAQAEVLDREIIRVPISERAGGVPDPALLRAALQSAVDAGTTPGVLVLTLPDNPTGTLASDDDVRAVCAIAAEFSLTVISDEIYRDLAYDRPDFTSPATYYDRVYITGGLSKSLALGGWRIGFARVPDAEMADGAMDRLTGLASEIWSSLAAPMQAVAATALAEPSEVTERIAASRALHSAVSREVAAIFRSAGAEVREPTAAFYLYPDFGSRRAEFADRGMTTSADITARLLEEHGIAILSGDAFGDDPVTLTMRVAVSLLYGENEEQRLAALASDDPTSLPWIADALAQLRAGLHAL